MKRSTLFVLLAPALLALAACSNVSDPAPAGPAAVLEPDASPVPLFAADDVQVGEVSASDDGATLTVTYAADPGWCLMETHLGLGTSPNDLVNGGAHARGKGHDKGRGKGHDKGRGKGHDHDRWEDDDHDGGGPSGVANPAPGRFPYQGEHDCVSEYTYTIDVSEFGFDADDLQEEHDFGRKLVLAAHAVVSGSEASADPEPGTDGECTFAMYGVDEASESGAQRTFYRIDDVPGQAFEPVATYDVGTVAESDYDYAVDALALDAENARLYFAERGVDASTLHFYDLAAGSFTVAGELTGIARGATFAGGGYYYVPDLGSSLMRVEFAADGTISGSSEVAGFVPNEPLEVVDLATADGVLYGSTTGTVDSSVGQFFSFDLDAGGGFTTHATYGEAAFHQLAFAADGTLYGTLTLDTVFSEIDPASGSATALEFWPQVSFADLASGAACETGETTGTTDTVDGERRTEAAWAGTKLFPDARNGSRYFVYLIEVHGDWDDDEDEIDDDWDDHEDDDEDLEDDDPDHDEHEDDDREDDD